MTWTKSEIQAARKIIRGPLLSRRGYRLRPLEHRNHLVENIAEKLVIKENYWLWRLNNLLFSRHYTRRVFWNDRKISGNTIDFFIIVEGMSFSNAMQAIIPK